MVNYIETYNNVIIPADKIIKVEVKTVYHDKYVVVGYIDINTEWFTDVYIEKEAAISRMHEIVEKLFVKGENVII